MNDSNPSYGGAVILIIILVVIWISISNQISNQKKQISELQAQVAAYVECVNVYSRDETSLIAAIQETKDNLAKASYGAFTSVDLENTSRALDINLDGVYCTIPDTPSVPTPSP